MSACAEGQWQTAVGVRDGEQLVYQYIDLGYRDGKYKEKSRIQEKEIKSKERKGRRDLRHRCLKKEGEIEGKRSTET